MQCATVHASLTGSDGSTPAQVGASASVTGILLFSIVGNQVTVKAFAPGTAVITYTAQGYNSATETVVVAALPNLVITDGPVS